MQPFTPQHDAFNAQCPDRLVIVGPPGCGKTRAALEHFMLPALKSCDPAKVLACSFSNAAADELRGRIATALGVAQERLRETCSTIHSEALRRYKRYGDPNPKLYDPLSGTSKALKRDFGGAEPEGHATSTLREAACGAWDYIRAIRKDKEPRYAGWCCDRRFSAGGRHNATEIEAMIERFEFEKGEQGAIDFTDMLSKALLYEGRELDLLLIDEAQDCTPLQWALIDHWAAKAARVVLIGDPDQAIHEWMGASYADFISRVRSQAWQTRVLDQSYRVPRAAHSAARYIVGRIADREDAEYMPREADGEAVVRTEAEVIDALHNLCREYVDTPDPELNADAPATRARSAFILTRTNALASGMRKALNKAAIPYPFAPSTAMRVRACIDLSRDGRGQTHHVRLMLEKLPAAWFVGTKKAALEAAEQLQGTVVELSALRLDTSRVNAEGLGAMIDALQGVAGDKGYWQAVVAKYPSWVLTEPPVIEVLTMHASKGREADFVALCAAKPLSVRTVDDAELRLLYVGLTRTRDRLWVFGDGYTELHDAVKQAAVADIPF